MMQGFAIRWDEKCISLLKVVFFWKPKVNSILGNFNFYKITIKFSKYNLTFFINIFLCKFHFSVPNRVYK